MMFDKGLFAQMTYIAWCEAAKPQCYTVNFPHPDGKRRSYSFSLAAYPKDEARRLAIVRRNDLWLEFYGGPYPGMDVPGSGRGNRGAVRYNYKTRSKQIKRADAPVGVYLMNHNRANGDRYSAWCATVQITLPNGKPRQQRKTFGIRKYGDDEAKRLAIAWRVRRLQELFDD